MLKEICFLRLIINFELDSIMALVNLFLYFFQDLDAILAIILNTT